MDSEQTAQEPVLFPHRDQETSPAMVPVSKNPIWSKNRAQTCTKRSVSPRKVDLPSWNLFGKGGRGIRQISEKKKKSVETGRQGVALYRPVLRTQRSLLLPHPGPERTLGRVSLRIHGSSGLPLPLTRLNPKAPATRASTARTIKHWDKILRPDNQSATASPTGI